MKRKHSGLILETLATASVLATFYSLNPIVGIVVTPLSIYCLIDQYIDENKDKEDKEEEEEK